MSDFNLAVYITRYSEHMNIILFYLHKFKLCMCLCVYIHCRDLKLESVLLFFYNLSPEVSCTVIFSFLL